MACDKHVLSFGAGHAYPNGLHKARSRAVHPCVPKWGKVARQRLLDFVFWGKGVARKKQD